MINNKSVEGIAVESVEKKVPDRELLKDVAIYLEGIYKGQGHIIPLGKIHIENLWTIIHSLNR